MPPVRYTIESFEDVAGYPGKTFYVLHEYPGTGCPQVPFVAIHKTKDGFRVRELEQAPVEEFNDAKYTFNLASDPRLQWAVDETEDVVSSETLSSANDETEDVVSSETLSSANERSRSPSMPLIQDVKSVDMEYFQKIMRAQELMVSNDGRTMERNGASKEFSVPVSESRPLVGKGTLPLTSRVIKDPPVPGRSINNSMVNYNASTSRASAPFIFSGSAAFKKTGSTPSVDTEVDDIPKRTDNTLVHQKASTSRVSLPVIVDGSVTSKKTGSAESADTKVDDVLKQTYNTSVNQGASTSRTYPFNIGGNAGSKKAECAESVGTKVDSVPKQTYDTLVNHKASTSRTSFPVPVDDTEEPKKTGSAVSVETKVDGMSSKSINTVNQDAETSRFVNPFSARFNAKSSSVPDDGEGFKKTESAKSEGHKESERSLPPLSCTNDSPALSVNTVPESPSAESTLELNKSGVKPKTKNDPPDVPRSDTCIKSIVNTASCSSELNVAPIDGERVASISANSVATVANTDPSPVKPSQPNTIPVEVTFRNTVVKEISSIITNILSEHVKSGNQPNESTNNPTMIDTETSELGTSSAIQETPEAIDAIKDSSPVTLGEKDRTPEKETAHKEVVKEITSIVTGIISDHKKSSESNTAHKDNQKKTKQLTEKRDKGQTDLLDKCALSQSKEISCSPRIDQKDLGDVYTLISRAQNLVGKKGSEFQDKIEDQPTKKEKSTKGSFSEPGCRSKEAESQDKLRKSKSTERVDEEKSEKVCKNSVTSVPKADESGEKIPKDPDNGSILRKRSSAPSFQSSCKGNTSSTVEPQARFKDSVSVVSERPVSTLTGSGSVKATGEVYNFPSDDRGVRQQKSILKRRNTVDGSENRSKDRTKHVSLKFAPYDPLKHKKKLEKHRPIKKTQPESVETPNSIEKPNDDGKSNTAGSYSCPGSPFSKNMKSSIEDIFNLQAILTDDSSPCNYSDITLKGPVQLTSDASLDDSLESPLEIYDNAKPTSNEKTMKKNTKISKPDNAKDSGKNSVKGPVENNEGSLSNYAEVAFSKTPKHDEDTKKKERKMKMLQLVQKGIASVTASVGVDKEGLGTSTISRTREVGESSKHCLPTVGMHKLPAMVVSSRSIQLKPVIPKKLLKNDGSDSGSNAESQSTNKVEMDHRDNNTTTCTNSPLEKEGNVKDLPKTSKVESKDQGEQLGDEAMKKQKFECSQSTKSPLTEIRKLQLALKRQKKLESPPSTSPVKNSNPTKLTKALPLSATSMLPTSLDMPSVIDLPNKCPVYSDLPPAKPLHDTVKKDVKKNIDLSKSGSPEQKTAEHDYVDKTESPKVSSKPDVPKKCSKDSSSENKHEKLIKRPSKVGDRSKEVSPTLKDSAVVVNESIVGAPRMVDVGSSVSKTSAVGCEKPATTGAGDISLTVERTDTVVASDSSSNIPSMGTDPLPTTESRKQLLRQLTSKITKEEIRSPFDDSFKKSIAQEGLFGLVSIGSNDLIEDKIKNVVEHIVKTKIDGRKREEKKKTSPMDPPTAEELGEFYSEIFEDATSPMEKDVNTSEESAEESNVADESPTAPVAPACTSDPKIAESTSDGKSDTHGNALEDEQNEPESHQKTTDTLRKHSVLNTLSSTVVLAKTNSMNAIIPSPVSESSITTGELESSKVDKFKESTDLGSCESAAATPASDGGSPAPGAQIDDLVEISSQDSSVDVDGIASSTQRSLAMEIVDVDIITPTTQRNSAVEIVDVDCFTSTSQRSGVPSSRRVKKRRRVIVDTLVPTIGALARDRKLRGNRLALLRKLVARRFSIEPFCSTVRNRYVDKLNGDRKLVSTVILEEPSSEAFKFSTEVTKRGVEIKKVEFIEPAVEVAKPEVIKPVIEVKETEVIKPLVEGAVEPAVEATKQNIIKQVVEVKEPEVTKPEIEPEVVKPVVVVTEPEVIQPLLNSIETGEEPLSTDIAVISEEENSQRLYQPESIPFLEDEEYPPKIVPQLSSLAMPRPIVTFRGRSRDEDDDVIITGVTSNTGESLLNTASNSGGRLSRSSSNRSPHEGGRQPRRKRLCTIPAPVLLPLIGVPPRHAWPARDSLPSTLEAVMPQPFIEFQNSPTSQDVFDPVTTTLPATSASTEPEMAPSSSSVSQRALSEKLRAHLGELYPDNDAEVSPHSGDSSSTRRVSVVPSEDGGVPAQSCSDPCRDEKKKRKRQLRRRSINPYRESAPSTSQNDNEGAPSTSQNNGTKTQHGPLAQSVGSCSRSPVQGDIHDRPSSIGNVEERQREGSTAGLLATQEPVPTRERAVLGSGPQAHSKTRKRAMPNIVTSNTARGYPHRSRQGREPLLSTPRSIVDPQESRQRRLPSLLDTPRSIFDPQESRQRGQLDCSRRIEERSTITGPRRQSASRLQEAPGPETYNDPPIDGRRPLSGERRFNDSHRRIPEFAEAMGPAHVQKNLQSRPGRSGLEESSGRRSPLLRETPQEVLANRAERHRKPPFIREPWRQVPSPWEQAQRSPPMFDAGQPRRRSYRELNEEVEVFEPSSRSTPGERSWARAPEGRQEETQRRPFPPGFAQQRPQDSQWPHQESAIRRYMTPRFDYSPRF